MIKACIREVTRALTPDELVHQTRTGSTGHDKGLEEVGMHAIETAQPDQAVAGLNGGMNGEAAEMSSAKFLEKVDEAGDVSKVTEEAVPDATGWAPERAALTWDWVDATHLTWVGSNPSSKSGRLHCRRKGHHLQRHDA